MSQNVVAFISLGSNMGDSENILRRAIELLAKLSMAPIQKSSLWQTTPVDCPPGSPPFVNAVAGITPAPSETPESLLDRLQQLEKDFGRKTKLVINEPRRLDLDMICFGNEKRLSSRLTLPHPRAATRRFVLAPLAEIAPDLVLLGQRLTVAELLAELDSPERVFRLSA